MTRRLLLFTFACSAAACAWAGCSRSVSAPTTAPVTGKVLYQGRPLAGVRVAFHPQADFGRVKFIPSGTTDSGGSFRLSTAAPNDGAPPGEYTVTFTYPVVQSDQKNSGIEVEVDFWQGKYDDPSTSHWTVQVKKGANDLEPFRLE